MLSINSITITLDNFISSRDFSIFFAQEEWELPAEPACDAFVSRLQAWRKGFFFWKNSPGRWTKKFQWTYWVEKLLNEFLGCLFIYHVCCVYLLEDEDDFLRRQPEVFGAVCPQKISLWHETLTKAWRIYLAMKSVTHVFVVPFPLTTIDSGAFLSLVIF